jgi:hypothetical protein
MQLRRSSYLEERDISESAELISSVLKENVSELKPEITDFQTYLSVNKKVNDTNFWNSYYLQSVLLWNECQ